jgi:hypothetical protein
VSSRSLTHRVFPPSKPPDGGYLPSFRFVVGGTQLCGSWYLSAVVRLQGFSSCSPVASLRRWSPKMVTSSSMVGESEPGRDLCPSLSLKDFHHQGWGGECAELGSAPPRVCGGPLLPSVIGGKGGSHRGAGSCTVPDSLSRAASEPLPVSPPATAAGRGSAADELAGATRGPTSNSTAFCPYPCLSSWGHGRGPPGSSIRPEVIAAAVRPPGAEVVIVAAAGAGDDKPFVGLLLLRRPPQSRGVVRTCGGGTGVPFIMAPWMPVFLFIAAVEA